ncbi:relaxase/mobilization nuclease domain-containing protein [Sphingomonas sp.]|jgi:hypothetical protein|uniref:relaxase/mobilization nuclease domain-containing protein n=1 Tax=Sphingomonas sp. TaxID=28214 RepID=UPI002EDAE966
MILKASQRAGAKQLGAHLLRADENEHVEVHEVSGFVSDSVMGAMTEAYAAAKGTQCKQYLFSVSLNPPADESVRVEVFETALRMIEERNGLRGQPRIVVFHEKEGRRHCHAVWSRIDADTMTAKPLPFFKTKLRDIAKQLYLENGWKMPEGFIDSRLRDPRNFALDEWQQAKREGIDPRQLKGVIRECWAASDNGASFKQSLEERGLFLARGERRAHVAVTIEGEVFSIPRAVELKAKDVAARLGDPSKLDTVEDVARRLAGEMSKRLKSHIAEAKQVASAAIRPLLERRNAMKSAHIAEREKLDAGLKQRADREQRERSARIRHGVKGAWDIITGRYFRVRKQNEVEAFFALQRDRNQRHSLVQAQLKERRQLQSEIVLTRAL